MNMMNTNNQLFLEGYNGEAILLLHGISSGCAQMIPLGRMLNDYGYAVHCVNVAGHGTYPEDLLHTSFEDMITKADYDFSMLKRYYDKVYVTGLSLGGWSFHALNKASGRGAGISSFFAAFRLDLLGDEAAIRAPIAGEVSVKLVEEGEVVGSGMPVVAITDLDDSWAVFHLREDLLKNITKGKTFSVFIPALDKNVEMEVSYIASVGDYATWRSSKESGGFDLKSFEVRLRPKQKIENLRPGMSVLFPMEQIQ